ncbi:hypothetical protein [Pseudoalteromonas phage J2-1_QLiu-2017]|nr:hypothetical protein [Pseudoalteromonas phage J2-1_QLiu-2017]
MGVDQTLDYLDPVPDIKESSDIEEFKVIPFTIDWYRVNNSGKLPVGLGLQPRHQGIGYGYIAKVEEQELGPIRFDLYTIVTDFGNQVRCTYKELVDTFDIFLYNTDLRGRISTQIELLQKSLELLEGFDQDAANNKIKSSLLKEGLSENELLVAVNQHTFPMLDI